MLKSLSFFFFFKVRLNYRFGNFHAGDAVTDLLK